MIDGLRIKLWRHTSFEPFVRDDIVLAMNGNIQVGVIVLTLLAIDVLGGYLAGKESDRDTFKGFITRYLPKYETYKDNLWLFRNGLVHDRVTSSIRGESYIVMTGQPGERHLVQEIHNGNKYLVLNRIQFAVDVLDAWEVYYQELFKDEALYINFERRLDKRGTLVVMFPESNDASPATYP